MVSADPLEVVAAVLVDARGRVLLTRRTQGRELAGLWEFPGGKCEAGETPEQALARELEEELGIRATVGAPLITVPHAGIHRRLRLDVRCVQAWQGTPRGREGQALAWVPKDKLARYAMPPADGPVVAALTQPDRYLVTPSPVSQADDASWLAALDTALATGVRRVHLRLPGLAPAHVHALGAAAMTRCKAAGADLLVSGDAVLADALGAGLHLRAAQLAAMAQRPVPRGRLLAASCHNAEDLAHAARLACDFVVLGPVLPTPTHPEAAGIGWSAFARLRETVAMPVYAIGGLGPADLPIARAHGAQGVAAIRALWG